MWVKICGNTNLDDAMHAAECGADAVGFVFAASKRQVTAAQVAAITPHLPAGVETVGVFDSHNPDEIASRAQIAGLNAVQLHGGFDIELLQHMDEILVRGERIVQTLHWALDDPESAQRLASELRVLEDLGIADRVLIDAKAGAVGGGTGVAYDWSAARGVFLSVPGSLKLVVAGGLRPATVADAIVKLAPWGVDVSGGVETSPGRKDPALVAAFINNARGAKAP